MKPKSTKQSKYGGKSANSKECSQRYESTNKRGGSRTKTSRMGKEDQEQRASMTKSTNDFSWYNRFPELTANVGNLWFSNRVGEEVAMQPTYSTDVWQRSSSGSREPSVPGIMTLRVVPGIGYAAKANDPINQVADSIYAFIRHANAGHTNYGKADLMMYLIVMDSAINFWSWLVRVYGCTSYFNVRSKYGNKSLMSALGVEPTSIINNLAEFRAFVNQVAIALARFAVPADMDLFKRHTAMFQNIYKDRDTDRAQLYAFCPAAYYVWDQTASGGPRAQYRPLVNTDASFQEIRAMWDNIISPISNDDDFGTMSGDLLKAYGTDGIYKYSMIEENYSVYPIYDRIVLSQIENAQIFMLANTAGANDIVQNTAGNYITWKPQAANPAQTFYPSNLLNIHGDDPTVEDIVEATRFMACATEDSNSNDIYCGSEIITGVHVHYMVNGEMQSIAISPYSIQRPYNEDVPYSVLSTIFSRLTKLAPFDWAPKLVLKTYASVNNHYILDGFIMDIDNYITIQPQQLKRIHEACILSMLRTGLIAYAG